MLKNDCVLCGGNGTIDIIQTWHELTIWCPECNPALYKEACMRYLKETGIDIDFYNELNISRERGK